MRPKSNQLRPGTGLPVIVYESKDFPEFAVKVGQADGSDPQWVASFHYGHDALHYADFLSTRYGYTVKNTVGAWIEPGGLEPPTPRYSQLISALAAFVRGFRGGKFYNTHNPYLRPEVKQALIHIGSAIGHPVDKNEWMDALSAFDTVVSVAPSGVTGNSPPEGDPMEK